MALTKEKKEEVFAKVKGALDEAGSVVFVYSKGMNVTETQEMRQAFRDSGVSFYVAKKTLVRRALDESKFEGEQPVFEKELAIAWGDDLVAPAREVHAFVKSTKDKVEILGGIFEGRYMNASEMTEIATIPSQQTLYAQFVNIINSPIQGFVMSLNQIAEKKEANA
jgi:large subunit ribosomal protein L10